MFDTHSGSSSSRSLVENLHSVYAPLWKEICLWEDGRWVLHFLFITWGEKAYMTRQDRQDQIIPTVSHLASRWKPWPPAGCFSSPRCKGKGRREQPYWCCSQQHRAVKPHHHTQPGNGPHGPAIPLPERAKINNKNLNQKYHFHDESLL